MKNSDESWEDYLYRTQECSLVYARLYGFEPFEELYEKGIIVPLITAIRLMYTGAIDLVYQVNDEGRLVDVRSFDVFNPASESHDPKEVLSKRTYPNKWWEVEGIKPKGYDERSKIWEEEN